MHIKKVPKNLKQPWNNPDRHKYLQQASLWFYYLHVGSTLKVHQSCMREHGVRLSKILERDKTREGT